LILSRQQKELLVIKLAEEGKSTRYIAQVVHISLKDIGTIIRRYAGEEEAEAEVDKHLSINSRAFKLFKENKNLVDVAISLNLDAHDVLDLHTDYLRLSNNDILMSIYWELGDGIQLLEWLYNKLKWYGLANKKDIYNILNQEDKLKNLDKELYETAGEIGRLNSLKMQLKNEVSELMEMLGHCKSVMKDKGQGTIL
jgi:hypothetical protein